MMNHADHQDDVGDWQNERTFSSKKCISKLLQTCPIRCCKWDGPNNISACQTILTRGGIGVFITCSFVSGVIHSGNDACSRALGMHRTH